jgi:hypothetical protein
VTIIHTFTRAATEAVVLTLLLLSGATTDQSIYDSDRSIYDSKGNRTGEIKERQGSFDVYDTKGNRIGTGRESPYDGSIRVYDPRTGQPLYEIKDGRRR